jgi:hypothetical protein
MTQSSLVLVDLSNEVLEHALAHAEQPTRHCHICANGTPIRPEDFDLAIRARLYNARQLMVSMIKHLGRQKHPQVSLTALYQLIHEAVLLQSAMKGEVEVTTAEM